MVRSSPALLCKICSSFAGILSNPVEVFGFSVWIMLSISWLFVGFNKRIRTSQFSGLDTIYTLFCCPLFFTTALQTLKKICSSGLQYFLISMLFLSRSQVVRCFLLVGAFRVYDDPEGFRFIASLYYYCCIFLTSQKFKS